jgi:hypothetical protein
MIPITGRLQLLKIEDAQRRGLIEINGEWCAIVKIFYNHVSETGSFDAVPVGPIIFPSGGYPVGFVIPTPQDEPKPNHVRDAVWANR